MNPLKPNLCVPMGLVVDNTREFLLDSLEDADSVDEMHLSVVSESMLDFLYDSMLIGPKPARLTTARGHKTKKKQPHIRMKNTK
jgi:hypothetical protein